MLFNSFEYFVFFPIVWVLYWLLPLRGQNLLLLAASYIFYSFWDWRFLSLIWVSTVVDYFAGLKIEGAGDGAVSSVSRQKKMWLIVSLCTNLGILGFFKYFDFFVESMESMLSWTGINVSVLRLDIILPVGISFYTFQTMSYTIDIYRGILRPTRKFLDFALYVSFFPQLVAGPIERAKNLLPMIMNKRVFHADQVLDGLRLVMFGLFKKVYVADNLAPFVDQMFSLNDPSGLQVVAGMYAFAIQIYCDFSGYSDIARGCAKCLGIELMVNFNFPYIAVNPADRWRRWHISLSTWLRDYLYIPLGGNRNGSYKTYRNLGLTMLLGGLWHGVAWNFIIWGAWEGMLLIVHRCAKGWLDGVRITKTILPNWFCHLSKILVMFHLVCIGWIIFRCPSLQQIQVMFTNLLFWHVHKDPMPIGLFMPIVKFGLPLFLFEYLLHKLEKGSTRTDAPIITPIARCATYSLLFYIIVFYGASAQSFIYFQF